MTRSTPRVANSSMNTTRMPCDWENSMPVQVILAAADADLNGALRIQQAVLDSQAKRGSVSELGTEELSPGVGMGIDVHHTDGRIGGNRLEYGVGNRMVAARADRQHAGRVNFAVERRNLLDLFFQIVAVRQAHIAQIGDPTKLVRIDPQREIEGAHEAR